MLSIWYFCLQVVRDPRFESLCGNLDVEGYVSVAFLYLSVNLLSACFMVRFLVMASRLLCANVLNLVCMEPFLY